MDTTATIPTGAMAERWTFKSFLVYAFFISMLVYPLYANWIWGGGWLSTLGKNFGLGHGTVDFAGSSVVHMTGGVAALVGAKILGPRLGKFRKDGKPNAIPGHHIPMALLGCFILAFGWFGFNAGSTLAGGDLRIGVVAVNTMLASAAGAFSSMFYHVETIRKTGYLDDCERLPCRSRGNHRSLRICKLCLGGDYRVDCRHLALYECVFR